MDTKDHIITGTRSLKRATTPLSSLGAHTQAPNVLPTPPVTGHLTNRGAAGNDPGARQPGQHKVL